MPAEGAYLSVLRTATAGLAARLDFTLDEIEDLRIAVDEACAQLLALHGSGITIRITRTAEGVEVLCTTDGVVPIWPPEGIEHTLAAQVLQGLTDEARWERDGEGPAVRILKRGVAAGAP
jgi:serine/threonine-protein kinase RsbW